MKYPKSLFLLTDLESVVGVHQFSQTRVAGPAKLEAMKQLTHELNIVIDAIHKFDSTIEIHCWDAHGSGGILRDQLHSITAYLPPHRVHLPCYLKDHNIDALCFIGQHAMANTPNGNQCHTMSSKTVDYYRLNGQFIGEFGLRTLLAAEIGVKTIYLSGDDKACLEARALVPEIITTEVMQGTGWESAISKSVEEVDTLHQKNILTALESWHSISLVSFNSPYELEIAVKKNRYLFGRLRKVPKIVRNKKVIYNFAHLSDFADYQIL